MPIDRYHATIRSGILTADDPIELLEGVLVEKISKSPAHVDAGTAAAQELSRMIPSGWHTRTQDPVTLMNSEPEPDVLVVRGRLRDFARCHPGAGDVALVVEVADSSLGRDRGLKKRIYATAGIATYWLVDLNALTLEVYPEPTGADYAAKQVLNESQSVVVELDGTSLAPLAVADLLPPAEDPKSQCECPAGRSAGRCLPGPCSVHCR